MVCEKGLLFDSCKTNQERKAFSERNKTSTSHRAQTYGSQQILSAKPYCELAVQQSFFETSQSCVSSTATLSHRFKSSPSIPGNLAMPSAAGYMMMAGHFRESHVSSGDLNRPRESRGSQPSACFLVTFCTTQKVTSRFPYGKVSRFCEPRFSSPQWRLRTNKIKTFPKGESRFSKPRFSPHKQQLPTNKIKSFAASRQLFPTFCRVQKVGQKTL